MKLLFTIFKIIFSIKKWVINNTFYLLIFVAIFLSLTSYSQVILQFNNGGTNGAYIGGGTGAGTIGAKYQWPNVGSENGVTIKAIIEIIARYGGASLTTIDGTSSTPDWEPQITGPTTTSGNYWGTKFTIRFYNASTGLPYTLTSFIIQAIDIDGGGGTSSIREYAVFDTPDSYTLENPTELTASVVTDGIKFQSGVNQYNGISITKTQFIVSCRYSNRNNVTITCGVYSIGGTCSGNRLHSLNFRNQVVFLNPVTTPAVSLPIELIDFKAELLENESVMINWTTNTEINNDYFTLERLEDLQTFSILSIINGSGNSDHQHYYQYIDHYPKNGISYYRLKQTDYDGNFTYSETISLDNQIQKKGINLRTNLLGQEVDENYRGLVFLIYDDGSTDRTIQ